MGILNLLYNFGPIEHLTTGTENCLSPKFIGPLGLRVAYVGADVDFDNGKIFTKSLLDLTQARNEQATGLNPELRNLSANRLGTQIQFHQDDGEGQDAISRIRILTSSVSEAIPGIGNSLDYDVRNPEFLGKLTIDRDAGELVVNGDTYVLTETDNPTSTSGQIYAFQLNVLGNWDGSAPIKITAMSGRMGCPKVSRDGDKIMFQEINSQGQTRLRIYNGLEDILNGVTEPYKIFADLRGQTVTNFTEGVAIPGGFGGNDNFIYWTQDQNKNFVLNDDLTSVSFTNSDFDIMLAHVGDVSGKLSMLPPGRARIPLPGNQITPDARGGRLVFASDYPLRNGNFNVYATSVSGLPRIRDGAGLDILNGYACPSGIECEGNSGQQEFKTIGNFLSIQTPSNPASGIAESGSAVTEERIYGPSGLTFIDNGSGTTPVLSLAYGWGVDSLATTTTGFIDPDTITIKAPDGEGIYRALSEDHIRYRLVNPDGSGKIGFSVEHFSKYAIGGDWVRPLVQESSYVPRNRWILME